LNILRNNPIDLAIVDWNMPVMNGMELLNRIRGERDLRNMPVVMVTGEMNKDIVAEAVESEIDAYIIKPLSIESLGSKISGVIERANNPSPMFSHLNRAGNFEADGNIDAAIEEFKLAMKADPSSSKPVHELGYLFFKKNDLERAEKWLKKDAKMNKLDVFAFHHLGELYLKRNDIDMALKFFKKAMNISPRNIKRCISLGKIFVQRNRIEKAVKAFDKAINLSGDSLSVREEIAVFCSQNGVYEYAIELMEFIHKNTRRRYDIMLKLGIANENLGKYRKALSYFIEALKEDKDNVEIKMHIAKNYIKIDQMPRAEQMLKSVLEIDPGNEEAKELLRQNV